MAINILLNKGEKSLENIQIRINMYDT